MGLRYLIGCSSLTSKDPAEGWQMYRQLERYRVSPEFETDPTMAYACPIEQESASTQPLPLLERSKMPESGLAESTSTDPAQLPLQVPTPVKVPKLLKTYLAIGAQICGAPAWDREFGTIDFLTLLDLQAISPSARNRFLAPLTR
jgi:hypothetical protein